ncbi:cytochrome c oxidase subunit 2 [Paraferrimonas haliotis]|uniref:Cytochrome c oxidase subunit 2 n=2 Tax=Paraferrimonas haliotis TaxID=2013866 RepID=A0AA37TLQ5_9GAMM|nr:cytochrome c oxidase subunit 2 [Paraferrimonas haliotis]
MTRILCWLAAMLVVPSTMANEVPLNLTPGATEISQQVYDLHMTIFYICCAIGVIVFGAMFYSMLAHRKSKGAVAATFHESTKVEILWTLIPFLILIGMAIPATKTLIAMEDPSNSDITIQVTGSQWKWHYKYFDQDIEFFSLLSTTQEQIAGAEAKGEHYLLEVDKPLVIPTGKKVRFLMTSDDVIHSWWVPAFAVKKDANPGFINEAWTIVDEPGTYRGQCAELCGKDHGFMPIVVEVVTPEAFDVWVAEQQQAAADAAAEAAASLNQTLTMEESMTLGEQVYIARCAACHQPNGAGLPGVFPSLKKSPYILGDVAAHIDIVVNGQAGTAMQAFSGQLTAKEIAAVVTYERNAWGNDTGDLVQAADVAGGSGAEESAPQEQPATNLKPVTEAVVVTVEDVVEEVEEQLSDLSMDELMSKGEQVYMAQCVACHQPTGQGMPPAFPSLVGSPITVGDVAAHIDIVVKGKPGSAMMGYGQMLTATEIAAVVTYERNAWGNNTGDAVQPSQVHAAKSGQ